MTPGHGAECLHAGSLPSSTTGWRFSTRVWYAGASMKAIPIIASIFHSDGGAMFGLVPRPIWSRMIAPDDQNRIPQVSRVLFVELDDGRRGIIDTGCGDPGTFSEREQELHALPPHWPLTEALAALGIATTDIDFVLLTHLHWDHGGGVGHVRGEHIEWTFPKATVFVHATEWQDACAGDPLLYKSYPAATLAPLKALPPARRHLFDMDSGTLLPGIEVHRSGGHTRGHCSYCLPDAELIDPAAGAVIHAGGILFAGDVLSSQHHLRMVFQSAYDTYPLDTRAWKRTWLPRVAAQHWALVLDHDPSTDAIWIEPDSRKEYRVSRAWPEPVSSE